MNLGIQPKDIKTFYSSESINGHISPFNFHSPSYFKSIHNTIKDFENGDLCQQPWNVDHSNHVLFAICILFVVFAYFFMPCIEKEETQGKERS